MVVDERRIPDPYLDELIKNHKMVRIFIYEMSYEDPDNRPFLEGSVSSYSALGISVVLLDGRKMWIPISKIEVIEEIDGGDVNCRR